jgi:hypothetical protein
MISLRINGLVPESAGGALRALEFHVVEGYRYAVKRRLLPQQPMDHRIDCA